MTLLKNSFLSVIDSLFKPKVEEIVNKPGYHFKIEQSFWSLVKEVQRRHIFSVNGQIIDLKDNMETEQGEIYSLYLGIVV